MQKLLYSIALLTLVVQLTNSQILINKEWEQTNGTPSLTFDYQTAARDNAGNVIIIGNNYHPGQQENMHMAKYNDTTGALIWEVDLDGFSSGKDFGIDVITDSNNDIYCTGTMQDFPGNTSEI